jgi:hypothetical protein
MEKIISNIQSTKDGKQEYLVQYGHGQAELDHGVAVWKTDTRKIPGIQTII